MSTQQTPTHQRGIVKTVLSGDTIIIRDKPRGGPPPEKQINISGINAPKLARRPTAGATEINEADLKDQPYAWEAREFLRKKLVGKLVYVEIETKVNNRVYGTVYLGEDKNGENMTEALVREGLATLRPNAMQNENLRNALEKAKEEEKGIHGPPEELEKHVRVLSLNAEDPRVLVERYQRKPIPAIIEHIRDGSTVKALLVPDFISITLMLSGIRCPTVRSDGPSDPYAEEAKFYTELRILQKDVEVVLESTSNANVVGSILHPIGNIAEHLLKDGFARCVDWSITLATAGADKLRAAEREAKEKRIKLWQNYTPSSPPLSSKEREYAAKVTEIVSADSLMVKLADDTVKKIFLSSVRPPRPPADIKSAQRPYDIPFMYEARDFLRKRLIGKKVTVTVDYIQPADKNYPQKECCTVLIGTMNVAEALVAKGLSTVVRYRQDEDKRSSRYDDLLAAEMKAQNEGLGLHNKKEHSHIRIINLFNDANKCKAFLSSFQRAGQQEAVVDYVLGGSRFRLLLTRDHSLITFLLAGITCPRSSSAINKTDGEPYGDEAHKFSKDLVHQKEVQVVVESIDKKGGYIGWMMVDNQNLSVTLVREGLATVHFTGEKSKYARQLLDAQQKAMAEKKNIWANYEPVKEVDEVAENEERKLNYRNVRLSEIEETLNLYAQYEEDGARLEEMHTSLRADLAKNPPTPGTYRPRVKDICAAIFPLDSQWYRAQVIKLLAGGEKALVSFIDYGNKETLPLTSLATLPDAYVRLPHMAHHFALACVKVHDDGDSLDQAWEMLKSQTEGVLLKLNVEYRYNGLDHVTLLNGDQDLGLALIAEGLALVDPRKERRLQPLVREYRQAEERARQERLNLWKHGDFTDDDAGEFGYPRY